MFILQRSGPSGSGPTGPGSGYSVMPSQMNQFGKQKVFYQTSKHYVRADCTYWLLNHRSMRITRKVKRVYFNPLMPVRAILKNMNPSFKMLKFASNCIYFVKRGGSKGTPILEVLEYDENEKSKISCFKGYSNLKKAAKGDANKLISTAFYVIAIHIITLFVESDCFCCFIHFSSMIHVISLKNML